MIKYHKLCKVCAAIKDDKRLVQDIFNTKFYLKTTGLSLQKLQEQHTDKFSYPTLLNHVKKHQFMSEVDYTKRHLNTISKQAEQSIIRRAIESKEVFDEVIGKSMEKLQAGEMELNANHLLRAAELKKNFQLKEQDQQLAMMEMVYHFTSGENTESRAYDRRIVEGQAVEAYDPAAELTDDTSRREMESRAFYQSLAGDTAPSGAN